MTWPHLYRTSLPSVRSIQSSSSRSTDHFITFGVKIHVTKFGISSCKFQQIYLTFPIRSVGLAANVLLNDQFQDKYFRHRHRHMASFWRNMRQRVTVYLQFSKGFLIYYFYNVWSFTFPHLTFILRTSSHFHVANMAPETPETPRKQKNRLSRMKKQLEDANQRIRELEVSTFIKIHHEHQNNSRWNHNSTFKMTSNTAPG